MLVYDVPASCVLLLPDSGPWTPLVRIGEEGSALPRAQEKNKCASEGFLHEAPLPDPVVGRAEGSI